MIRRSYRCDTCAFEFEHVCDKGDPDPDCPVCSYVATRDEKAESAKDAARMQEIIDSGRAPAVIGYKAKAVDFAQKMAEEDYGLTNMRDGAREGEAHFMPDAPLTTAQAHEQAREMMQEVASTQPAMSPVSPALMPFTRTADPVQAYWGGGGAVQGAPGPHAAPAASMASVAPAAAAAREMGADPVGKLHEAGRRGLLKDQYQVVGRAKIPEGSQL